MTETATPTITEAEIERLSELLAEIGALPLCPEWMYSSIRHCQRNMDFDEQDGFNQPDRQSGSAIAELINALPALLEAARQRQAFEAREARLREAVLAVVNIVRDYLPPDGISKDEFVSRVIGATDNPEINPIIRELENGRS